MKLNVDRKSAFILLIGILSFYGFKNYAKKVKDQHSITTSIASKLFDFNTFELTVDETLNLSDFKIVNQNSGNVIFANGKRIPGIENDYGHRLFEVYYQGKKIFEFGHFATNNWYTFDYEMELTLNHNQIKPELKIMRGGSPSKLDFFLNRIE